ncbi:MAG: Subtilisin-like serine protease, partial [bacterium]
FNQNAQVGIVDLHRQGYTGAGIIVAILDSGFRTGHAALATRNVLAERDFVFNDDNVDNEPGDVVTAWNHGTSVWSNMGGYRPGALVGGAFEAGILLAKTEDISSETPVEEDNFIAAIEWADSLGADVITASLVYLDFDGSMNDYTYADLDGDTTPLAIAVDMAVARGICMVNAVGNFGPGAGSLWTPADADSVLSVGAVDSVGVVASFSSHGPTADGRVKPEVVARGRSNYVANAGTGGYGPASGTSFSAPVTAGAAALLKEAHPNWSGWQLREALRSSANHAGAPDNSTGWGLVRLGQALAQAPPSNPLVSRPFSLQLPDRGVTIPTAAPTLVWEHSQGNPGDVVSYRVVLGTSPTFAGADTFAAGIDSTWIPPMFLAPGATYHWQVLASNLAGWEREALRPGSFTVSVSAGVAERGPVPPPVHPTLAGPYPNPVTREMRLFMVLPARAQESTWSVTVVGVDGRLVRRLATGTWES